MTAPVYTREYLKGLKAEADAKVYNDKLKDLVATVSKAIVFAATNGSTELVLKTRLISPPKRGQLNLDVTLPYGHGLDTITVYDVKMIYSLIDELKKQFVDSDIKCLTSSTILSELQRSIVINWT